MGHKEETKLNFQFINYDHVICKFDFVELYLSIHKVQNVERIQKKDEEYHFP